MAVVKINDKENLDILVAQLTLRLGHKVHQQDILDACVRLSLANLDQLEQFFIKNRLPSKETVSEILSLAEDFPIYSRGSIDEDLYGGA